MAKRKRPTQQTQIELIDRMIDQRVKLNPQHGEVEFTIGRHTVTIGIRRFLGDALPPAVVIKTAIWTQMEIVPIGPNEVHLRPRTEV